MNDVMRRGSSCTVCASHSVKTVIDFGLQSPANRFVAAESLDENQDMYSLGLGYCSDCATIQLSNRMPMQAVKPRYNWLVYSEAEQHLDDLASQLRNLPGINMASRMLGATYKDQSTLDRLTKLGLPIGECLPVEELNIFRMPIISHGLKTKYAPVDLLLARHVLEHALDAVGFIRELKELIAPDGYLVLELPDSEKVLCVGNHAFIWEEHISYFTEQSLSILAAKVGAKLVMQKRYPYNYEDSLVVVFQFTATQSAAVVNAPSTNVNELLQKFSQDFAVSKIKWRTMLQQYRDQGKKVAVFGAGHLATKFINFLDLSDLVDCVIDDNAHKAGMYMPGSKLPILPSSALKECNIPICISTLSPESEQKVKQKLADYFAEGGVFIPAFKIRRQDS